MAPHHLFSLQALPDEDAEVRVAKSCRRPCQEGTLIELTHSDPIAIMSRLSSGSSRPLTWIEREDECVAVSSTHWGRVGVGPDLSLNTECIDEVANLLSLCSK